MLTDLIQSWQIFDNCTKKEHCLTVCIKVHVVGKKSRDFHALFNMYYYFIDTLSFLNLQTYLFLFICKSLSFFY